ncbi:MAG: signal peptidase II [Albimonas sp.]|uniref:signal peptidase II n=1 Tax=Albimonas sp. TaxID=1872425 RepID=UPI0040563040
MRAGVVVAAACAAFLLDQASKWYVLLALDLRERLAIDVAPPFLRFTLAWNTGANFGFAADIGRGVWITAALAISVGLAIWSQKMPQVWRRASVGLLIGGALGNALDRAIHGAVFDFLNMSCCGIRNPYAFNVADVCIFAGAAGLILLDGSDKQRA